MICFYIKCISKNHAKNGSGRKNGNNCVKMSQKVRQSGTFVQFFKGIPDKKKGKSFMTCRFFQ